MSLKKRMIKKAMTKQEEAIIDKITDDILNIIKSFDKDRTIGSIKREEVENIAKEQYNRMMKNLF